ncbi:hypothetical protein AVEN_101904-1 [Araneus ventricosus]|uniref:RNase H type-1 domain-containing protein n=1 Tax=Araneus ventricosus TaxID=182803 RepID=A0A4Y2D467_ARAVE|nr:hypothetical protein AVEN_240637-1 [Araneus ventricosus]GBM13051.1 hypothetical protein AVEN_101904-1 [Araneus ventricosus]
MWSKVINPIYGSLFSIKLSFTPTFGFRIGEILRTFKIQDFTVVVSINAPSPLWQEEHFDFIDDFVHFLKQSTSYDFPETFIYEHRQRYRSFIPVYTDGSKFEDNVGSAAVFPDIAIAEKLHPFCSVFTSELYVIYLGLLKIATSSFSKFIIYTDSKGSIEALKSISSDHDSNNCSFTTPKCYNCNGEHPSFFRSCPRYKLEKKIQTVKITKNISFQEARKIVNERTPKPGLSYSSALNSVVSPLQPSSLQNPRLASTIINTTTAPLIINTPADNEIITKKATGSLLEIKKSWEEAASSSSVANTGSCAVKLNSAIASSSSVSQTCAILPVLTIAQPSLACFTVGSRESRPQDPIVPVNNSFDAVLRFDKSPSVSNSIALSKSNSSPLKLNVKTNRKIKKQGKKSNELEKAKESKSVKLACILAAKRDQDISKRSLSRKEFLKDSLKEDNYDDDSDSLLKFHPSEDGMSTSEVDDLLPS